MTKVGNFDRTSPPESYVIEKAILQLLPASEGGNRRAESVALQRCGPKKGSDRQRKRKKWGRIGWAH